MHAVASEPLPGERSSTVARLKFFSSASHKAPGFLTTMSGDALQPCSALNISQVVLLEEQVGFSFVLAWSGGPLNKCGAPNLGQEAAHGRRAARRPRSSSQGHERTLPASCGWSLSTPERSAAGAAPWSPPETNNATEIGQLKQKQHTPSEGTGKTQEPPEQFWKNHAKP